MLISTPDRWERFCAAREQTRARRGRMPEAAFYESRLREVWERARRTPAHRDRGDFSLSAFRRLPATTKDAVKAAPWDFAVPEAGVGVKYYETTGTTGLVTPTPRFADDVVWNVLSVAEAWRDLLTSDDRAVILLPSDVVPVGDLIVGVCEYLDVAHTRAYPFAAGICDWDRLIALWQRLRPSTVFLAPGVSAQFTRLLKRRRMLAELREPVERLMLLGEVNTAPFRARLGQWWQATVHDASFGSTETGTLAATCPAARLHLLPGANYFELATGQGITELPASGSGRLVVTPLNLFARPLLRYDTGDEVTVGGSCPCGNRAPVVTVGGRGSDAVEVRGVPLSVRAVEEIVYGATAATGYVIETAADGGYARLLLERDVDWDRSTEPAVAARLRTATRDRLGLAWDEVVFVNALPDTTKAGAAQKSWKRSNVRPLAAVVGG
ncbi:phenylacetate--CoA ligase family protein [Plantactinospora sp. WMMB334]|uniref:phenylacetate--CoA ligase family protein n=1 Tax=Plantactinospora sp. WMMB334 TaxID=3404119 RepID=UPI003B923A94